MRAALDRLAEAGLLYRLHGLARRDRGGRRRRPSMEAGAALAARPGWRAALSPASCSPKRTADRRAGGAPARHGQGGRAGRAALTLREHDAGRVAADPARWGDVVLRRKDIPASYHIAVVVDDALQGVTDVVRGRDLHAATSVHRLLQALLGLPEPRYRHHELVLGGDGEKLVEEPRLEEPAGRLRAEGMSAADVRALVGFD